MAKALHVNNQLAFWSELSLFSVSSFSRLKLPKCIFEVVRDIYIKLTKEFDFGTNAILNLIKPLYGISDSNIYWRKNTNDCFQFCPGIESIANDGSFFSKMLCTKLSGLFVTYVDDFPQVFAVVFRIIQGKQRNFHPQM